MFCLKQQAYVLANDSQGVMTIQNGVCQFYGQMWGMPCEASDGKFD